MVIAIGTSDSSQFGLSNVHQVKGALSAYFPDIRAVQRRISRLIQNGPCGARWRRSTSSAHATRSRRASSKCLPSRRRRRDRNRRRSDNQPIVRRSRGAGASGTSRSMPRRLFVHRPVPLTRSGHHVASDNCLNCFQKLRASSRGFRPAEFPVCRSAGGKHGNRRGRQSQRGRARRKVRPTQCIIRRRCGRRASRRRDHVACGEDPVVHVLVDGHANYARSLSRQSRARRRRSRPCRPITLRRFAYWIRFFIFLCELHARTLG